MNLGLKLGKMSDSPERIGWKRLRSLVRTQVVPTSLTAVLGLAGVSWLTSAAVAPSVARAYTATVNVTLPYQEDETYESFLRRAEAVARAAAQRSFDGDILVTEVAITISAQNKGAIAPVLFLNVSREAWQSSPDPQRWATYFPGAEGLLGFGEPDSAAETPPPAPTAPELEPQEESPPVLR
jgi:hypothetical protein